MESHKDGRPPGEQAGCTQSPKATRGQKREKEKCDIQMGVRERDREKP